MSRKQNLQVLSIEKSTPSSVVINLSKMDGHNYVAGQYITFELEINGEQVNRSYSFCSAPNENNWQVGVKHVPGGKASSFLNEVLKEGDSISCLEPMGNFLLPEVNLAETHYQFFAAGSGITPIFSMIKTLLSNGNSGKISLFYGNKSPEETMFLADLQNLAASHSNFNLELIYSQSRGIDSLHSGRMNFGKTLELLRLHPNGELTPQAFVCGPGDMISSIKNALIDSGYSDNQLHMEFFSAPTEESSSSAKDESKEEDQADFSGTANVKVMLDDDEYEMTATADGPVLLDVALNAGLDAPFSCKGGVCTACRAKLTKGKVDMVSNFALTDEEINDGYILTCQARPCTNDIEFSYDD